MIASEQAFNSRVLSHLNHLMYKGVLTEENISSNEIALKIHANEDKRYAGFVIKEGLKNYFLLSDYIKKLPIKINNSYELIDNKQVYHIITKYTTIKLPKADNISFRDLIDNFCNIKHTSEKDFLLWKIIIISAYIDRVNVCISTNGGFGKDSVIDSLRDIINNACKIDKATYAKLEYVLKFPLIVCNEVASLKKAELEDFESFGLSVGAFQNKYVKRSRKTDGTKEIFDISCLSLCFTFNNAKSYLDKGEKCFNQIFRKEFLERFLPIKFEGWIIVDQFKSNRDINYEEECNNNIELYKSLIQKINWLYWINFGSSEDTEEETLLRQQNKENLKHKFFFDENNFVFSKEGGRHKKSFITICNYIGLYSKDQNEFDSLCNYLYVCHKRYLNEESYTNNSIDENRVEYQEELVK